MQPIKILAISALLFAALVAAGCVSDKISTGDGMPPSYILENPQIAARSDLQSAINNIGTLLETMPVVFSKNATIASETLAAGVSLAPSQVCLDLGDYRDIEPNFKLLGTSEEGTQAIQWVGTTDKKAKIVTICALSGANLNKYIDVYSDIYVTAPENCACLEEESRCCLVQLKRADAFGADVYAVVEEALHEPEGTNGPWLTLRITEIINYIPGESPTQLLKESDHIEAYVAGIICLIYGEETNPITIPVGGFTFEEQYSCWNSYKLHAGDIVRISVWNRSIGRWQISDENITVPPI